MPTLSTETEAIIAAFEKQPNVIPDQVQNLCASIESSAAKGRGGGLGKCVWRIKAREPYFPFRLSLSFHAFAQ
ncbi:hypothetical protein [Dyella nitratireducens]|uniref:Uncharacterized protein n=1 Tax=Dyella nitratireducens TaxID=1849580 RepID=A0ABQ1FIE8_9GAMM|nr:hypothetical protein [Dyella nitratireducens]GGA16691.1 hypothetical protein GCM10010981_00440 [Dyella nitratireducens]GLQ44896.1 hypothetical protein GCM10007902_47460 [Dyella nitratireducens]